MDQAVIDGMNSKFWNEPCGTQLAKVLGIEDDSPASLQRFDEAFFATYPYLLPKIIRPDRLAGRDVLEIGLGYGSVSQQIAGAGARYTGLDIAAGAVRMANLRMQLHGFAGRALQGTALQLPFPSDSFDFVISIGCIHHTGNTQRCVDEIQRVLRPGGSAIIMVYNKFSFRHWNQWPWFTFKELLRTWGVLRSRAQATEAQRLASDANSAGSAAPETAFYSQRELRAMLAGFESVSLQKQNTDNLQVCYRTGVWSQRILRRLALLAGRLGSGLSQAAADRIRLIASLGNIIRIDGGSVALVLDRRCLLSSLGRAMGLDIYVEARKGAAQPAATFAEAA
jgi:SAM-dependent methyltransferase